MVFSSTEFVWLFLPIILLLYGFVSLFERNTNLIKNILLLVFSLIFYAWGEPKYILLMLFSITINYILGLLVGRWHNQWLLFLAVCMNLGCLGLFKYFNFFMENINAIFGSNYMAGVEIRLPIGISFYTFQALSYVIDVYRGDNASQKNPLNLALYISFFPQLIAGPIVKYKDIEKQLKVRRVTSQKLALGIRRFIYGLGKKIIISNTCAGVTDTIFALGDNSLSTPIAWVGIICYLFQIYYDFSGYSDMAIGLGKMFGFDFLENFNFPYISASIQEFWRRWHISLSSWFKEYLYIPLGGNRKGKARTYINLLIVFFCTGFWHGASWNFIVWGMFHGMFQLLERGKFGEWLKKDSVKIFGHIYAMLVVTIGWVFFRAETLSKAWKYLVKLFSFNQNGVFTVGKYLNGYMIAILVLAILFCGIFQKLFPKFYGKHVCNSKGISSLDIFACLGIVVFSGILIICDTYNPFIYFQF